MRAYTAAGNWHPRLRNRQQEQGPGNWHPRLRNRQQEQGLTLDMAVRVPEL
jgi:hypothetical protein